MKTLLLAAAVILSNSAAFAQTQETHRPFIYETACALETKEPYGFIEDTCKVIETRETGGALRSRNIFSNKFGLTIKSRYDEKKGFVTYDSHNKFEYAWTYKVGGVSGLGAWTMVMPGFYVQNVSWD